MFCRFKEAGCGIFYRLPIQGGEVGAGFGQITLLRSFRALPTDAENRR